ncbi:Pentapeptide repeat [uncultured Caudovirales phage]|uniref:Pentapeptide repeat n=1 Tax=uncultured Caudovirales phage TaxID=2100421 RepID=A0A6J5RFV7_9CAUD|nr:Pentapeptide repeat [uncultured Caudovirales phage]CAB4181294.1 Pentapeptide repeat [uncultured Caudovirales phage]CAB4196153.1 Pentapeptide repeat [uncultured Caudovirales phage]CAB4211866.1 Pentapeptide repeat [uncultured Caudovirales phage]
MTTTPNKPTTIQIFSNSGPVLFRTDTAATMRDAAEQAVAQRGNLSGAYLSHANLSRANLSHANLSGAYLSGAYLSGADLSYANLSGADLSYANLSGAYLSGADLSYANLSGAYLSGANLSRAIYRGGIKIGARGLLKTCSRSDGYDFHLFDCEDGGPRVDAGCRWFTLPEAWLHWTPARDATPLGEETFDILVMFEHHIERINAKQHKKLEDK